MLQKYKVRQLSNSYNYLLKKQKVIDKSNKYINLPVDTTHWLLLMR